MDLGLKDKVACVTGSSRGIGRAVAAALLREGAFVMVTGRDEAALADAVGGVGKEWGADRVASFVGDLTEDRVVEGCIEAVRLRWGRLDVLVANVGSGRGKVGWDLDAEAWKGLLSTNLVASSIIVSKAVPLMRQRGGGSIALIGSIAGLEAGPAPIPYASAKAGLMALNKSLSRELAPHNVRVNLVAPGNICFEGGVWDRKRRDDAAGVDQYLRSEVPMKRFGTPEEVADTVAFICSSRASFMTGACVVVDGGQVRTW
jgi:3-oxoacyl-[acyl-carrier protein] reductase